MCRLFVQAETKGAAFEHRSAAYVRYVSTGSAESGGLQAGMGE